MKKEKREELKKRILDHKINDENPRESIFANKDANIAKYNAYLSISEMCLGILLSCLGIAGLVFVWPFGLLMAIPTFLASLTCELASHDQLSRTKKYGKRYGLNLRETFKAFSDKEVFEALATNTKDIQKESEEPKISYDPKQPIFSLSDEELLGIQTTEFKKQNKNEYPEKPDINKKPQIEEEEEEEK